ncbi:MAG TPA: hypothetical protein VE109_02385, partial [Acidobacteriaceae bacterium]|nr:hypothetical protein [Acidobacteriaceae bacterium]
MSNLGQASPSPDNDFTSAPHGRSHSPLRSARNATSENGNLGASRLTGGYLRMLHSLRYALRQLRNSPGFAATAIFSILDAVLLQPLPFPHPDRLVAIASMPDETVAIPTTQDWQSRGNSFQSIAAYRGWSPTVQSSLGSQVGNVVEVTQNFFSTLGASFALGGDLP